MEYKQRTVTCGQLTKEDVDKTVVLNGWVHRNRNHGGINFVDLRDRYGITQLVVDKDADPRLLDVVEKLRMEYCIAAEGTVRLRPSSMINKEMRSGEIEVVLSSIEILSKCEVPPFVIDTESDAKEDTRLRYRYLDLRSFGMQNRIRMRHLLVKAIREFLWEKEFYEIETPTLIRSTPEGARDFLVPSRHYPGKFYALPQSPQLLKQLLMIANFDKYFQIARCYRDEDARGDRQLEFTQLDLEMSFVKRDDVLLLMEELFGYVFKEVLGVRLPKHFKRLSWQEAMDSYGLDKPDLRYELKLVDVKEIAIKSSFETFKNVLANNGAVKAIKAPFSSEITFTRKFISSLEDSAKVYGAKGLAWMKVASDNTLEGGVSKFFENLEKELIELMEAKEGDLILFVADEWKTTCSSLGAVRSKLAKELSLFKADEFSFCWIIDFPLFEKDEETGNWQAAHHMFSMPQSQYIENMEKDPANVKGDLYDLVLNGYEVASGSIRIHDAELQKRVFRICNIDDQEAQQRFGFFLNALHYGAPPHGGIAPGVDRLAMIMAQQSSIKEVIAFPKNTAAISPMDEAPSTVDKRQLEELHLIIKEPENR